MSASDVAHDAQMSALYNPLAARRDSHRNPLSGDCAWHLRRMCGTCRHFAGGLRSQGQHPCRVYDILTTAADQRRARGCRHWSRPDAQQSSGDA